MSDPFKRTVSFKGWVETAMTVTIDLERDCREPDDCYIDFTVEDPLVLITYEPDGRAEEYSWMGKPMSADEAEQLIAALQAAILECRRLDGAPQ